MRFGGGRGGYHPAGLQVRKLVQICKPTQATQDGKWQSHSFMNLARMHANALLLPDGSIFVIGGTATETGDAGFVMTSENLINGIWWQTNPMASGRGYHSTAVLLPNGMVLVAGGDGRSFDYQLYKPPYLFRGARPTITSAVTGGANPDKVKIGSRDVYQLTYEAATGAHVEKVVLMRPCSTTHHSDFEQRSVALEQVSAPDNTVMFHAPPTNRYTPEGPYMLFVVDNNGVPFEATWVELIP